jgi:hypothetical protein
MAGASWPRWPKLEWLGGRWHVVLRGKSGELGHGRGCECRGSTVEALGLLYRHGAGEGVGSGIARRGRTVSGGLGVLWRVSKGRTRGRSLLLLFKRL